jgi:hypothetical protein
MYLIFTVTIILLITLFYFFDLEVNIILISCGIIILLFNSLFYKRTYEKFHVNNTNNINKLHEEYNNAFNDIKGELNEKMHPKDEYNMIPIYSSIFNDEIFQSIYDGIPIPPKGINKNII